VYGAATFRQATVFASNTAIATSNVLYDIAGLSADRTLALLRPVLATQQFDAMKGMTVHEGICLSNSSGAVDVFSSGNCVMLPTASVVQGSNLTLSNAAGSVLLSSEVDRLALSNVMVRGLLISETSLGIGVNDPLERLHVAGNAIVQGRVVLSNASGAPELASEGNLLRLPGASLLLGSNVTLSDPSSMFSVSCSTAGVSQLFSTDDPAAGTIFKNSSSSTADGGAGTMTVRNDGGMLRLAASDAGACNALGIFVTPSNNCVGIGTSNPATSLHVIGQILASEDVLAFSDSNYKQNIQPIPDSLAKLGGVTGYTFSFAGDPLDRRRAGVLAQEVQRVLPEVVYQSSDDGKLQVAYGNLVALVINAVNDLRQRVEALEACKPSSHVRP
jgi:hypothetical protein